MSTEDSALLGVNRVLDNAVTSGIGSDELWKADRYNFTILLVTVFLVGGGQLVGTTEMSVAVVFLEMDVVAEGISLEVKGMLSRRLEGG